MIIGVSGAKGSFSEEAARMYAEKEAIVDLSLEYLISVEGVLSALEAGSIDIGIFPTENSSGGPVIEAVEAMPKHTFTIQEEFGMDIRQNLLGMRGVSAAAVTVITSHDQALKQCKEYLKREWPHAEIKIYEDTAKAAEDLAAGILASSTAVIAPKAAADIYGLDILAADIQDLKNNVTTFVVVKR